MPERSPREAVAETASPLPSGSPADDGLRVLLVGAGHDADAPLAQLAGLGLAVRVVEPGDAGDVAAAWQPRVVLVDAALPGVAGLLRAVGVRSSAVRALTAPAVTGEILAFAAGAGAETVVASPFEEPVLRRLAAWQLDRTRDPGQRPELALPAAVIGSGQAMRDVWRLVVHAAASQASVVVVGETGAGKEVVARALHRFSARQAGPFLAVNAAALPEALLESELFGHEKGAFTGATAQHQGRFELAQGGSLFLDEIGELPPGLQAKLLRVLQERSFERVGGTRSVISDVRVIAATNRDLEEEVRRGRFRSDLYYRLNVISVRVPPLRERRDDILPLWDFMLGEAAAAEGRAPPQTSSAVQRILLRHDWPGNVRELHNTAQHALTVATGSAVMPADLPAHLTASAPGGEGRRAWAGLTMAEIERAAILDTYEAAGTVKAAAALLGISERTVHYRLRRYRAEGDALPQRKTPSPAEAATAARLQILLAEDDDELRWALSDILKSAGYDVIAVADGRALLERVGAAALLDQKVTLPDLILADVRMPGLTGMQLLERLRDGGWTTPVVLMSAFGDPETKRRAVALGAKAFVEKPIDFAALQRVIDGAVAN